MKTLCLLAAMPLLAACATQQPVAANQDDCLALIDNATAYAIAMANVAPLCKPAVNPVSYECMTIQGLVINSPIREENMARFMSCIKQHPEKAPGLPQRLSAANKALEALIFRHQLAQ